MRFSLFLQSTAKSNVGYDFPLSYTLIYYYFLWSLSQLINILTLIFLQIFENRLYLF